MTRRASSSPRRAVSRVAGAVKRTAKKVTAKLHRGPVADSRPRLSKSKPKAKPQASARKRQPQSDIPVDVLNNRYTPQQTSLKSPFRASGRDRQNDQEFGRGIDDDRWNDEDHLTNKSGDPRIGTHGRTYEPGEARLGKGRR